MTQEMPTIYDPHIEEVSDTRQETKNKKIKQYRIVVSLLILLVVLCCCCGLLPSSSDKATPITEPLSEGVITYTLTLPSLTPTLVLPTVTPIPIDTKESMVAPTPENTQTFTPTETPMPTNTKENTKTPTPKPTNTSTPVPIPTATLIPTKVVIPLEVEVYIADMRKEVTVIGEALGVLGNLLQDPKPTDFSWKLKVATVSALISGSYEALQTMYVPSEMKNIHSALLDAVSDCDSAMTYFVYGLDNGDTSALELAGSFMLQCTEKLKPAKTLLDNYLAQY